MGNQNKLTVERWDVLECRSACDRSTVYYRAGVLNLRGVVDFQVRRQCIKKEQN